MISRAPERRCRHSRPWDNKQASSQRATLQQAKSSNLLVIVIVQACQRRPKRVGERNPVNKQRVREQGRSSSGLQDGGVSVAPGGNAASRKAQHSSKRRKCDVSRESY